MCSDGQSAERMADLTEGQLVDVKDYMKVVRRELNLAVAMVVSLAAQRVDLLAKHLGYSMVVLLGAKLEV